jgi:hypothetical protein
MLVLLIFKQQQKKTIWSSKSTPICENRVGLLKGTSYTTYRNGTEASPVWERWNRSSFKILGNAYFEGGDIVISGVLV